MGCSKLAVQWTSTSVRNILALIACVPGFPGGSDGKDSTYNTGDTVSVPGFGRFPGERNGYPLQYSCLENSMDRGAWQTIVHGAAQSDMTV